MVRRWSRRRQRTPVASPRLERGCRIGTPHQRGPAWSFEGHPRGTSRLCRGNDSGCDRPTLQLPGAAGRTPPMIGPYRPRSVTPGRRCGTPEFGTGHRRRSCRTCTSARSAQKVLPASSEVASVEHAGHFLQLDEADSYRAGTEDDRLSRLAAIVVRVYEFVGMAECVISCRQRTRTILLRHCASGVTARSGLSGRDGLRYSRPCT
jgi:hypothetical protein